MTHPTQEDDVKAIRDALEALNNCQIGHYVARRCNLNDVLTPERLSHCQRGQDMSAKPSALLAIALCVALAGCEMRMHVTSKPAECPTTQPKGQSR